MKHSFNTNPPHSQHTMENMKAIFRATEETFNKHKNAKNIEIEFRVGKIARNGSFDPNIGKAWYDAFVKSLKGYKKWEDIKVSEYEVYYGENNKRTTIDSDDNRTTVTKKRVKNIDVRTEGLPFDVRMSVSTETPDEENEDEVYEKVVTKKRWSFVRKGLSIDITQTSGENDIDSEEEFVYNVEFEIMDPKSVDDKSKLYNHIYKIYDLFRCASTSS